MWRITVCFLLAISSFVMATKDSIAGSDRQNKLCKFLKHFLFLSDLEDHKNQRSKIMIFKIKNSMIFSVFSSISNDI
jgi:hypothetical protein